MNQQIPSLNLKDFTEGSSNQKAQFVQDLGSAFNDIGFVAISGHGLSNEMSAELYQAIKQFFSLSEEEKLNYEVPGIHGQRGYVAKRRETAKGHSVPDLKEFYHIGQPKKEDGDTVWKEYPENVFPTEIPSFGELAIQTYQTLEQTGKDMLRAIALYLDLQEDYFEDKVINGNSILRAIHYFPIMEPEKLEPGSVRAAAHGDINLITLLMGASAEGLEVLRRDGEWIPITALPNQLVVNVGDMLDRLTNHKLKSTIHRVVNPPLEKMKTSRYSIPFFMHPRSEMDLTCLESCINTKNPKIYSDMTAGEFLDERLKELGLKN